MQTKKVNKSELSEISKHPLRNCYMLICTVINGIPPYFGTLPECEKAKTFLDKKVSELLKINQ